MTSPRLLELRESIEGVDRAIVALIAERVRLAREVGAAKREAQLPTLDHAREAAVVRRAVMASHDAGLDHDEEIRQLFWQLIGLCRRAQADER